MVNPVDGGRQSRPRWHVLVSILGALLVLAGLVALISPVESSGKPSVDCGGPSVSVARSGGRHLEGRADDCRAAARDQVLGSGLFLVAGGVALIATRRRRGRSQVTNPEVVWNQVKPVMEPQHPGADPGWRPALLSVVPGVGARAAQSHPTSELLVVRMLFLAFAAAIGLFGFVLTQLGLSSTTASLSPGKAMTIVGAVGIGALVLGPSIERPLDCASAGRLVETWRTRFFVRLAIGETPALVGFAAAFISGRVSAYFVGASATAVMFVRAAPSARNIARDQQELYIRGCQQSLYTALATSQPVRPGTDRSL